MKLLWIGNSSAPFSPSVPAINAEWELEYQGSPERALEALSLSRFDAALLSTGERAAAAMGLLDRIWRVDPLLPTVVHDPLGTYEDVILLTRHGASYVLIGEANAKTVSAALVKALESTSPGITQVAHSAPWRRLLVGQSRPILEVCAMIELVAAKRCTVLITGDTGTGKEIVARAIHIASPRASFAMVAVNCTALPAPLIESELFGHARGAFTGAHTGRIGRFEQAHRGTIFLDEIGDLPFEAQAKLLRILQEQELQRVGSSETVRVDVRVIAASNVDLEQAARERRFREDLFYRLNVVPIQLPALRERREDIPLLLEHFCAKIAATEATPPKRISDEAVAYLQNLEWPGNVRQLEHAVQMAFALSGDRRILWPADFQVRRKSGSTPAAEAESARQSFPRVTREGLDFDAVVGELERSLVKQALTLSKGNKAKAAELLRMKRTTLLAKMKVLNEATGEESETAGAPGPQRLHVLPKRAGALVVESNETIRLFLARILQRRNCQVLEANTQAAAQELVQCWENNIALLITAEEFFPGLSPLQPALGTVVLCDEEPGAEGSTSARVRFIRRPFSSEDLVRALDELRFEGTGSGSRICA